MRLKRKNYLKVGIVGCGAIGSSLAKMIAQKKIAGRIKLASLYDLDNDKARHLANNILRQPLLYAHSLRGCIQKADLIIEAASAQSCVGIVKETLKRRRSVLVMSVGGLKNSFKKLSLLAQRNKVKIYIPSGAISGIDAVKAAKFSGIKKIILITRKPPISFKGVEFVQKKRINLDRLSSDKVIFCGSAGKAVQFFPQNINVAAVLSLAGKGFQDTQVCIVASPKIKFNTHKIELISKSGRVVCCVENIPHPDNPKTSFFAVLSAACLLERIVQPIEIGS